MRTSVKVTAAAILGLAVVFVIIPFALFGPKAYTYLSYLHQEKQTPDKILANRTCGSYQIQLTQYDLALKYRGQGLGSPGTPPRLLTLVSIDGTKNGTQVFATGDRVAGDTIADENHAGSNSWPIVSLATGFSYANTPSIFVIDTKGFKSINTAEPRSDVLVFNSNQHLSKEDVGAFAQCYMEEADDFNTQFKDAYGVHGPISAFLLNEPSGNDSTKSWEEFDCSGKQVVVNENSIQEVTSVDGSSKNIEVGTLSPEGDFHSETSDIAWNTCKTQTGKTFQEYADQRKGKIKYLDSAT